MRDLEVSSQHCVLKYVTLLKNEGPKEWIYEEFRDILTMHFRFKDKETPSSYVSSLVHSLQDYPLEEVLSGGYLISSWRPDLIDMVLNYITPEKIRVAVIGKKFEAIADQEEPWYGTKYKLETIPEETIEFWKQNDLCEKLKLPPKNEFIPTTFDLLPRDENGKVNNIVQRNRVAGTQGIDNNFPAIIQDTPLSRVWFKQDDEFLLPKANISFEFASPLAYLDPLHSNMMHMFVRLFKDALNEYAYAAELAGLKWELSNTKYGMILGIVGYSSKQHILLEKIIERMTNFQIDPKRFAILKENYIRSLKNFEAEQPYQHAVYYLAVLLVEQAWTKVELLAATEELTVERVAAFIPQILSNMHIECFIHGNVNKAVSVIFSFL
ncbi:hypothetical protein J437_LFUL004662 [Ladona fulva]|uniref:Peptidase M16 middle/third domain-containing protein n=1 Tax=Ladona fulva TaxID=123851 RepID=A0A8K0K279_LADFU|nr:hypothetical protein J437_LFUL004662 [Ladona fulva]